METNVLAEVIEAEKAIQAQIEREQASMHERLENVRREAAEEIDREERLLAERFSRRLDEATVAGSRGAEKLLQAARGRAAGIREADEGRLREIVAAHLPRILTG